MPESVFPLDYANCCERRMLDELDSNTIVAEVGPWLDGSYEKLDLAVKWKTWMTSRAAAASKKAETFVTVSLIAQLPLFVRRCSPARFTGLHPED